MFSEITWSCPVHGFRLREDVHGDRTVDGDRRLDIWFGVKLADKRFPCFKTITTDPVSYCQKELTGSLGGKMDIQRSTIS